MIRFPHQLLPLIAVALLAGTIPSGAQIRLAKHVSVDLLTEENSIQPGRPFWAAVRLRPDSGWHFYWRNAGDAGMPTSVDWRLPNGFTVDEIEWPYPHLFGDPPEVSYGYEEETLLMARITPPVTLGFGTTISIEATVSLLACQEVCIPGRGELSISIPVHASDPQPRPESAAAFLRTRQMLPTGTMGWRLTARREEGVLSLRIDGGQGKRSLPSHAIFFAAEEGIIDHSGEQSTAREGAELVLRIPSSPFPNKEITRLRGVLYASEGWGEAAGKAIRVDVPIEEPTQQ